MGDLTLTHEIAVAYEEAEKEQANAVVEKAWDLSTKPDETAPCKNCDKPLAEHADRKCLFDSTDYEARWNKLAYYVSTSGALTTDKAASTGQVITAWTAKWP